VLRIGGLCASDTWFCLAHVDKWFRGDYAIYVDNSREKVAQYVNAETRDVVLVENASTGVNAVLRSLKFAKGDRVLHTNIGTDHLLVEHSVIKLTSAPVSYGLIISLPYGDVHVGLFGETRRDRVGQHGSCIPCFRC
jgi:hypothetical protein